MGIEEGKLEAGEGERGTCLRRGEVGEKVDVMRWVGVRSACLEGIRWPESMEVKILKGEMGNSMSQTVVQMLTLST